MKKFIASGLKTSVISLKNPGRISGGKESRRYGRTTRNIGWWKGAERGVMEWEKGE